MILTFENLNLLFRKFKSSLSKIKNFTFENFNLHFRKSKISLSKIENFTFENQNFTFENLNLHSRKSKFLFQKSKFSLSKIKVFTFKLKLNEKRKEINEIFPKTFSHYIILPLEKQVIFQN